MVDAVLNFYQPEPDDNGDYALRTKAASGAESLLWGQYPSLAGAPESDWPSSFEVFRVYENMFARLWAKLPGTRPGQMYNPMLVEPDGEAVFRGQDRFPAPWPEPPDRPTDLRFIDDLGNISGLLRVRQPGQQVITRRGDASLAVDPGALAALAGTGEPMASPFQVRIGRGNDGYMAFQVTAGDDPTIGVEFLTPWAEGDLNLSSWLSGHYLPALVGDQGLDAQLVDDFMVEFEQELNEQPIAVVVPGETEFHLNEGASHEIDVTFVPLDAGPFLFALRLTNYDSGDVTISDMVSLEVVEGDSGLEFVEHLWADESYINRLADS